MPVLIIAKGPEKGRKAAFRSGREVVVGTAEDSLLRLSDASCSARHLRVFMEEGGSVYAEDLGSESGTLCNGAPIEGKTELSFGDTLSIGTTVLKLKGAADEKKKDKLIGFTVGGYKIIEQLGRGGMGTVYKAMQVNLDRVVALKILSREWDDPDFVEKFKGEARAAGALNHPNIIQVYDVGDMAVKNGVLNYFSMEFAAAGNVQEILDARGRLPAAEGIKLMIDAAAGLDYAEKKSIVHRDIKPENLMVTDVGAVKIGDLGLAQRTTEEESEGKESKIFGTPHYVAPEQVKGEKVDHRADLYSLGATFYRVLAGTTPFSGNNVKEIIVKQVREDPPDIRDVEPSVPEPIARIIRKMMKKDPAERYQHFAELLEELKAAQDQLSTSSGPGASGVTRSGRPRRQGSSMTAALGTLAVAIIGIVALLFLAPDGGGSGEDGGDTSVVTTNGDDGSEDPDLAKLEIQAVTALKDAEYKFKNKKVTRAEIEEYRRIAEKFEGTESAAKAARRVEEKEAELKELVRSEARRQLDNLRRFWRSSNDVERLGEILEQYDQWKARWKGTEIVGQADGDVTELKKKIDGIKGEIDAYLKEMAKNRDRLVTLAREGRFAEILTLLQAMRNRYKHRDIVVKLREQIRNYTNDARLFYVKARSESDAHRQKKEYAEAIAALEKVLPMGIPNWVDKAKSRIAELKTEQKAYEEAEAARVIDADCERYELLIDKLEAPQMLGPVATAKEQANTQRRYEVSAALRTARNDADGFTTEKYKARVAGLIADLEGAESLLLQRSKGSNPASQKASWGNPISFTLPDSLADAALFKSVKRKGQIVRLIREGRRGWVFEFRTGHKSMPGVQMSPKIALASLDFDTVFDLLTRKRSKGKNIDPQLASIGFALSFGRYEKGYAMIESLKKSRLTNAQKAVLARYETRLSTQIEPQVQDEFDRAHRLNQTGQPREAINAARRLQRRYFETNAYKKLK